MLTIDLSVGDGVTSLWSRSDVLCRDIVADTGDTDCFVACDSVIINNNNNNNTNNNFWQCLWCCYMTPVISRIHPVHLMNVLTKWLPILRPNQWTWTVIIHDIMNKAQFPLPELMARVDGWPVSITRQHGRPSTWPVLMGSGNRALVAFTVQVQQLLLLY